MSGTEKTLHSRFSKTLLKRFFDAAKEYGFFKSGDTVQVSVSSDACSLLAAALLKEYERFGDVKIKLILNADSAEAAALCSSLLGTDCTADAADKAVTDTAFECFDDIIEDILAGVLFEGRAGAILPKETGIIRPLYKIRRRDIVEWKNSVLPECAKIRPLTPERQCTSEIIGRLNAENPQVCRNVFRSVCTVRLDHIISYTDFNGDKKFLYEYSEK